MQMMCAGVAGWVGKTVRTSGDAQWLPECYSNCGWWLLRHWEQRNGHCQPQGTGGKTSSVAWFLYAGWRVLCGRAPQRGKPGGWQLGLVVTWCRQGTERCGCRVVRRLQSGRGEWVSAQLTSARTGAGSQRMQEGLRGPYPQRVEGWVGQPIILLRGGWCSWAAVMGMYLWLA